MSTISPSTTDTATRTITLSPRLAGARRALVRLQAARASTTIIRELIAETPPRHDREPTFLRTDRLAERYAALGGDPADLLRSGGRPPAVRGDRASGLLRRAWQSCARAHDDNIRRELHAQHERLAERHATGGDYSDLT
jgi:hypothetical protein